MFDINIKNIEILKVLHFTSPGILGFHLWIRHITFFLFEI